MLGHLGRKKLRKIGIEVGQDQVSCPGGAEIHDTLYLELPQVIGKLSRLQGLEQAAHHNRLADAAPPHDHHQS